MKKLLCVLLMLSMLGCVGAMADEKAPEDYTGALVVYSPHDADPLAAGVAAFSAKYPNIEVSVIADGTGTLLSRIAAEAENPVCDVLWGGGADSLAAFKAYFQPYVCANDDVIADEFKDAEDLWIGESPLPMVIMYNKNLVAEEDIPETWEDLLDEKFFGAIAYANPASSGSAYTQLCTMVQAMGGEEDGGWDFVEEFYANLDGKVQSSSGNCHKLVASGEYALGVTIEKSAVLYADNPDVGYIYPAGDSAVPDGVAIVKDCPNLENAQLFTDFVTGLECQTAQHHDWARRPVRSDMELSGLPTLDSLDLINYDFDWAANEKEAIVAKWTEITTK